MHKSSPFFATLALLLGCGAPAEVADPRTGELTAAAAAAGGDESVKPPPPVVTAAEEDPVLKLSEQGLFFGQICEGDWAEKVLTISNVGGGPLVLRNMTTTGEGFWMENRPGLPYTLGPGQRYNLRVRFWSGASRLQPYNGTLRIVSNDPADPVDDVVLSALSLPGSLRITPRQHDFGTLRDGGVRTFDLTLRNTGECPVFLGSARATGTLPSAIRLGDLPDAIYPGGAALLNTRLRCGGEDSLVDVVVRVSDSQARAVGSAQLLGYCAP